MNIMTTNYYNDNVIDLYVSTIDSGIFIDEYNFTYIINNILERLYFNHLLILFCMSCMTTMYICSYGIKKSDYVAIHNVEPILIKSEEVDKSVDKSVDKV